LPQAADKLDCRFADLTGSGTWIKLLQQVAKQRNNIPSLIDNGDVPLNPEVSCPLPNTAE